jgi:hypothetical protein
MTGRQPLHPFAVLALAVALPGMGQVAVGQPQRGFDYALFALIFAALSWHTTTADQSFVGRSAGGLFIWALAIPDAYRMARHRYDAWRTS